VCIELEEEKAKHARDMEQGDNVTYMLEKDRERLKQEVCAMRRCGIMGSTLAFGSTGRGFKS